MVGILRQNKLVVVAHLARNSALFDTSWFKYVTVERHSAEYFDEFQKDNWAADGSGRKRARSMVACFVWSKVSEPDRRN